jgi:tRNA threonylcarbamoyladenosine biosynthesis protein TsaB
MRILGIDTSTKFLSIGVLDNSSIYEYNLELDRRHSSLLAPSIQRVLDALGWKASCVDYFACGLGPGSFTGVRIGLSAIKGLGFALKKPLIGIPTLDILARNVKLTDNRSYAFVVPVLDAKRGLVYCSVYRNKEGSLERVAPYTLATLDELYKKIKPNSILLGDALSLYKEQILKNTKRTALLDKDYWYPCGRHIVILAQERIRENKIDNLFKIKPIYLYPKECQIKK